MKKIVSSSNNEVVDHHANLKKTVHRCRVHCAINFEVYAVLSHKADESKQISFELAHHHERNGLATWSSKVDCLELDLLFVITISSANQ